MEAILCLSDSQSAHMALHLPSAPPAERVFAIVTSEMFKGAPCLPLFCPCHPKLILCRVLELTDLFRVLSLPFSRLSVSHLALV